MANVIKIMFTLGCVPVFTIVEKRYALAAKIVEIYLNNVYNPIAYAILHRDALICTEIANYLCAMPQTLLQKFSTAYRALDISELESLAIEFTNRNAEGNHNEILSLIPNIVPELSKVILAEQEARNSQPNSVIESLNFPIFIETLILLELIARGSNTRITLYHDKTSEYEVGFNWAYDNYRSFTTEQDQTLTNLATIPSSLEHIKEISMLESNESLLIQAADILAGLFRSVSVSALKNEDFCPILSEVAAPIYPLVFSPHFTSLGAPQFGAQLASDSFTTSMVLLLHKAAH